MEEILYDMTPDSRFPNNPIESFRSHYYGKYHKVTK